MPIDKRGNKLENAKIMQELQIKPSEAKILHLLGDRVYNLQTKQALNHNDLPLSYIDPQAIVATGLIREITSDEANAAIIPLDYLEGYPVINGLPFWEKLDGEVLYFYRLFKSFRDMKEESGSRSLLKVAELSGQAFKVINNLSRAYHWQLRVKAYDSYKDIQLDTIRRTNIQKMENKHYKMAEMLFDKIKEIIEDILTKLKAEPNKTPEYQVQIRSWFKEAVKLERLSLGIAIDKPSEIQEAVGSVITNYTINRPDNRQVNINPNKDTAIKTDKLEAVLDVLSNAGVLNQLLESKNPTSGGNGHKEGKLIDIKDGKPIDVKGGEHV